MMRLMIAAGVLGCCSALLSMPGCGPSEADAAAAQEDRPLSFVIVNKSGGPLKNIGLEGANYPMSFRDLDDGLSAEIKSKKLELPETLTLHWSNRRGDRKEGTVQVWGNLGPTFSGPVTLTVNQRGKVVLSGG